MTTRAATMAEVFLAARGYLTLCQRCDQPAECDDESGLCVDCTQDAWRAA